MLVWARAGGSHSVRYVHRAEEANQLVIKRSFEPSGPWEVKGVPSWPCFCPGSVTAEATGVVLEEPEGKDRLH